MLGRIVLIFAIALSWLMRESVMAAPAPTDIAKVVTFIFLADENGEPKVNPQTHSVLPNGTGFFVFLRNENGPGGYGYLVTAKHVLLDEKGRRSSRGRDNRRTGLLACEPLPDVIR
jgi:hypothetical protein